MVNHKLQSEIEALNNRAAVHYIVDNNKGVVHLYFAETPEDVSRLAHGVRALSLAGVKSLEYLDYKGEK